MSVLIKGMKMPKSCYICPFIFHEKRQPDVWCTAVDDNWLDLREIICGERHPNCPLVLILPHGDLIDRNVLYKKTAEWEEQARHLANTAPDAQTFDKWATILTERSAFKFDVADAPTIIEAEEGET